MLKLIWGDSVRKRIIDGNVFRLHYKVTCFILINFCIMVSTFQFFGKPIICDEKDGVQEELVNTFCWTESTFALPKTSEEILEAKVRSNTKLPRQSGVDQHYENDPVVEKAYYQLVYLILILQTALFYFPRFIWKRVEGGLINDLLQDFNDSIICIEEVKQEMKLKRLANNIKGTKGTTNYALSYFFCQILNLINVVLQMYFTNKFLGGAFIKYGRKVLEHAYTDQDQRFDPMIRVFPRISKCAFHKFGESSSIDRKYDTFCLLPLNIINEHLYIFLWFWFIILTILTGLTLAVNLLVLLSRKVRVHFLMPKGRLVYRIDSKHLANELTYGQCFLLHMLGKNLEKKLFSELLRKLEEPEKWKCRSENEDLSISEA